ncbi:SDR family oxidoreductase [Bacillus sp. B190/17]|uniref:SDR family oxidoreductase n=1 Tax=Bacillus lumedeiriae TaxID=3058829 RepID=A0ABW8IAI5_9BACI
MNVLVIGAGGLIGKKIVKILAESNQHLVRSMICKAEQMEEMEKLGSKAILADLGQDFSFTMNDVNAVIFADEPDTSADPGNMITIGQEGAKKAADFAKEKEIERFVLLSALGTNTPGKAPPALQPYLDAKKAAEEHLMKSKLNFTIVRSGRLTNEPGTGMIGLTTQGSPMGGAISREDAARVLVESLLAKGTEGKSFEIVSGSIPIKEALKQV